MRFTQEADYSLVASRYQTSTTSLCVPAAYLALSRPPHSARSTLYHSLIGHVAISWTGDPGRDTHLNPTKRRLGLPPAQIMTPVSSPTCFEDRA